MSKPPAERATLSSRLIQASPEALYGAFMDPEALVEWLPPGGMTGQIHSFEPRIGGGYEMSLFYPHDEAPGRGKTAAHEDRVRVRFADLAPPRRIVWAVTFVSEEPALAGEMIMTWTFQPAPEGTLVSVLSVDLPPGLKAEDNRQGSEQSLAQLARRFEA